MYIEKFKDIGCVLNEKGFRALLHGFLYVGRNRSPDLTDRFAARFMSTKTKCTHILTRVKKSVHILKSLL